MNAEEYKRLINEKNVLDYTTLNVTLKEVVSRQEPELAGEIRRILQNNKIEKPEPHLKTFDTSPNYYRVDLSSGHIDRIVDIFFELEEANRGENGEPTPVSSFYASLVDKWDELG